MNAIDAHSFDILNPLVLGERCSLIAMSGATSTALAEGLGLFERQPALKPLLWHCVQSFYNRRPLNRQIPFSRHNEWKDTETPAAGDSLRKPLDELPQWPDLPEELDPSAGLFYVYVFLAGLPRIFDYHREKGISAEITLDTLSDMELWIEDYRDKHGKWGFDEQGWLARHFSGRIYKLGRLQFEMRRYGHDYHAFRARSDGRIEVVAGKGQRFRADGLLDGSDGYSDPGAWTAGLKITDSSISAHRIGPEGKAVREPINLSRENWDEILKHGDSVLAVHIPATGPMYPEECRNSFARAIPFFSEHFPSYVVRAFTCSTWLLDPQLEQVLDRNSNILRFLREWHLTPEPGADDSQTIERVFGLVSQDMQTWPRDTTLQRAMLRFMRAGGTWRMGAGLIFPDDVEHSVNRPR